jgi:hypothetical protein
MVSMAIPGATTEPVSTVCRGFAGLARRLPPGLLLVLMAGCASTMDVRPLATDRADQSAFELTGSDLDALRREAGQLCPQGGEVLRQAAREQRLEAVDSRLERWLHFSSQAMKPSERHAQLVVLCHPVPDRHLLAAAAAAAGQAVTVLTVAASGSGAAAKAMTPVTAAAPIVPVVPVAPAAPAAPVVPIGPLSVEW